MWSSWMSMEGDRGDDETKREALRHCSTPQAANGLGIQSETLISLPTSWLDPWHSITSSFFFFLGLNSNISLSGFDSLAWTSCTSLRKEGSITHSFSNSPSRIPSPSSFIPYTVRNV